MLTQPELTLLSEQEVLTAIAERIREAAEKRLDEKIALVVQKGDTLAGYLFGSEHRFHYREQPRVYTREYPLGLIIAVVQHRWPREAGPYLVSRRQVRVWVSPGRVAPQGAEQPGSRLDLVTGVDWVPVFQWERWVGKNAARVQDFAPVEPTPETALYVPGHWERHILDDFQEIVQALAEKREAERQERLHALMARWMPAATV